MRVVKPLIALCPIFISLAVLAADVVVMRDGSQRSGKLSRCEDAQCSLSGKRIPMAEIRAIYLDGTRKEVPVRSSAIVMRDGSVRAGRVTFINQGTVDTDEVEIDRSLVAAILFSGASDEPVSDLLILRNGPVKRGTVTTCNAASCTLDGAITPLANIEWVGLARENVIPPSSAADEVHKTDGTVVAGRMSGIDESSVSTTRGAVPRAETAWIHLAEPAPAPRDQPGSFGAPPSPPSPPVQPPTPQPPAPPPSQPPLRPPSAPTPREPNRERVKPCPADRPLGGHVVENLSGHTQFHDCRGTAELWFVLVPHSTTWPASLSVANVANEIVYRLQIHGCTAVDANWPCTAPSMSASGTVRSAGPNDSLVSFYPDEPTLRFEVLPKEIEDRLRTPITCGSVTSDSWRLAPSNGVRPYTEGDVGTPPVQPTLCFMTNDEARRTDCMVHPDRYAVVPFRGEQRRHHISTSTSFNEQELRWDVCCGCGEPPSGPPPEFSRDPCGDLGVQRGFLQIAVDTSAALRRELKPHLNRFLSEKQQAAQWRNDFDYVSNSCAGWDIAVMLTEALLGGAGAAEGLGPTEGAQAFAKLLSIIQAVIEQDPTIPLTAFLGAAEELEVAGETALEVTLLGIEGFTTSGVIDTVGSITNGALEFLEAGEVQSQRERLEDCTDTPLVAGVTFDGAREYLDHAEAAARALSATLPLLTRLEQSDTNIYNTWAAYHQACLQYAECKGLDPAVCNPPPP